MSAEQEPAGINDADALAALETFVADNDDLLALESRIGRFNIFDALGIARAEIRHSNFLAFILDPAESHGQGQIFLKALLADLLKQVPPDKHLPTPIDLEGTELLGVQVRREWEHIDILISCRQPSFVVVIENKVDAHEHDDQLRRYKEKVRQHHPHPALFVYLTPDADEPSDSEWMPYSYAAIHAALTRILATSRKVIGEDVLVFLDHYLSLIGTRFMNDEKLEKLCQQIYKKHRRALDLIWERVGSPGSGLLAEVAKEVADDNRWSLVHQNDRVVNSVPAAWLNWLPPLGSLYDDPRIWIVLKFELNSGKIDYFLEMHGMADPGMGKKVAEFLLAEIPKFGFQRSSVRKVTNYTHLCGREQMLKWGEEDEPEPKVIRVAVKKTLDDLHPKLEKLALVLKQLF
jgi:hypothetical protein